MLPTEMTHVTLWDPESTWYLCYDHEEVFRFGRRSPSKYIAPAAELAVAPVRRDVSRKPSRLIAFKSNCSGALPRAFESRLQVNAALCGGESASRSFKMLVANYIGAWQELRRRRRWALGLWLGFLPVVGPPPAPAVTLARVRRRCDLPCPRLLGRLRDCRVSLGALAMPTMPEAIPDRGSWLGWLPLGTVR